MSFCHSDMARLVFLPEIGWAFVLLQAEKILVLVDVDLHVYSPWLESRPAQPELVVLSERTGHGIGSLSKHLTLLRSHLGRPVVSGHADRSPGRCVRLGSCRAVWRLRRLKWYSRRVRTGSGSGPRRSAGRLRHRSVRGGRRIDRSGGPLRSDSPGRDAPLTCGRLRFRRRL